MKKIERKYIDWKKTGKNLEYLRNDNLALRRYVCFILKYKKNNCDGKCESCRFDMDKSISRNELSQVFNVSESVIFNWENGKTPVSIEDMLFYCEIAEVNFDDILVYEKIQN